MLCQCRMSQKDPQTTVVQGLNAIVQTPSTRLDDPNTVGVPHIIPSNPFVSQGCRGYTPIDSGRAVADLKELRAATPAAEAGRLAMLRAIWFRDVGFRVWGFRV